MAVELGLSFDLSGFKAGLNNARALVRNAFNPALLNPFDAAIARTAKLARKIGSELKTHIGAALSSVGGQLVGVFAGGAALAAVKQFFGDSIKAAAQFEDSIAKVDTALKLLSEEQRASFDPKKLSALTRGLRLTTGVGETQQNEAFAGFLGRGFAPDKAGALLQASVALSAQSGKELREVSKIVADAAHGAVDGLKGLGIQITATGDKKADAIAATEAMFKMLGAAQDLADPIDLLAANWEALKISTGAAINPQLNPYIMQAADAVAGLTTKLPALSSSLAATATAAGEATGWFGKQLLAARDVVGGVATAGASLVDGAIQYGTASIQKDLSRVGLGGVLGISDRDIAINEAQAKAAGSAAFAGLQTAASGWAGGANGVTSAFGLDLGFESESQREVREATAKARGERMMAEALQRAEAKRLQAAGGFAGDGAAAKQAPKPSGRGPNLTGYASVNNNTTLRIISRTPDKLATVGTP